MTQYFVLYSNKILTTITQLETRIGDGVITAEYNEQKRSSADNVGSSFILERPKHWGCVVWPIKYLKNIRGSQ